MAYPLYDTEGQIVTYGNNDFQSKHWVYCPFCLKWFEVFPELNSLPDSERLKIPPEDRESSLRLKEHVSKPHVFSSPSIYKNNDLEILKVSVSSTQFPDKDACVSLSKLFQEELGTDYSLLHYNTPDDWVGCRGLQCPYYPNYRGVIIDFILLKSDKPIGHAAFLEIIENEKSEWELAQIYILHRERRKHYATLLLEEALKHLKIYMDRFRYSRVITPEGEAFLRRFLAKWPLR